MAPVSRYVMSCYAILHSVMLCYAVGADPSCIMAPVLRYIMLLHVHVMLCYASQIKCPTYYAAPNETSEASLLRRHPSYTLSAQPSTQR